METIEERVYQVLWYLLRHLAGNWQLYAAATGPDDQRKATIRCTTDPDIRLYIDATADGYTVACNGRALKFAGHDPRDFEQVMAVLERERNCRRAQV